MICKQYQILLCGQVGLVVLLIGAVLMTIGLGVASQSVLEIKTSRQEVGSSEAFNAAEQGVEQVLQNPDGSSSLAVNNYDVKVNSQIKTDSYTGIILSGKSAQLNTFGANSVDLTWIDGGSCNSAIVVTLINSSYELDRQVYARKDCYDNKFTAPTSCDSTTCTEKVDLSGKPVGIARIKAIYGETTLTAALAGSNLQPQYTVITSTASGTLSNEVRSIQVTKSPAAVPGIFDYGLFTAEGAL